MKKDFMKTKLYVLCALFLLGIGNMQAQEEGNKLNPRGVFKLMSVINDQGKETKEPFDQYKICTDSVTLNMQVQGNMFRIAQTDSKVYDYTGSEPADENDHSTLIFDSSEKGFSSKWWGVNGNHAYFSSNGWTTEVWRANEYSPKARIIIDALTTPPAADTKNPFIGTWHAIGMMDELRNVKKEMERIRSEFDSEKSNNPFAVYGKENMVISSGQVFDVKYEGKNSVSFANNQHKIIWISTNVFAIEVTSGWRTDYEIWERVTDGTTPMQSIAHRFVKSNRSAANGKITF